MQYTFVKWSWSRENHSFVHHLLFRIQRSTRLQNVWPQRVKLHRKRLPLAAKVYHTLKLRKNSLLRSTAEFLRVALELPLRFGSRSLNQWYTKTLPLKIWIFVRERWAFLSTIIDPLIKSMKREIANLSFAWAWWINFFHNFCNCT